MPLKKDEISLRQLFVVFIMITAPPVIRLLPIYTMKLANQAAWISPIITIIIALPLILVFQVFFNKFKDESYLEITRNIFGKVIGNIVNVISLLWITVLVALYARYYADRIVSSIFPNVSYTLFVVILLAVVLLTLRTGVSVFARLCEVFFPIVTIAFLIICVLIFPVIKINNFTPITYKDIYPVLQGSKGAISIFGYLTICFIWSDKVKDKSKLKKLGFITSFLYVFLAFLTISVPLGVFGHEFACKMNLPFFAATKEISLFSIIERVESATISIWIITDFIIITAFSFVAMRMTKDLFKNTNEKSLINVYLVIILILTMYITNNINELKIFSTEIATPINIFLWVIVPFILFAVGKIRKKI